MVDMTGRSAIDTDLSTPATWAAGPPHDVFDELRVNAPVHWQPVLAGAPNGGFWSLSRYQDIMDVSRDKEHFTITRGAAFPVTDTESFSEQMMQKDPPEHTRLRRIVSRSFTPRVVGMFETWIREIVVQLVEQLKSVDSFDFVTEVAAVVPALVISDILGVPRDRRHDIVRWANANFAAYIDAEDLESNAESASEIIAYGFELREEKRRRPGNDIISALVESQEQLTDQEYSNFFLLLLMAGFETTHTMMAQGMRAMLEEKAIGDQVEGLCARSESAAVVEEILRYVSPVNEMVRCATTDVTIGSQRIPAGDMVTMWYVSANRDPSVFDKPQVFDATRNPNPHMGFGGGGTHLCIGAHLARLEGRILLEEMSSRGLRLKLDGDPVQVPNMFLNQLGALPVALR
jgi:cholest-4-en-3-one 26-monooxygenase